MRVDTVPRSHTRAGIAVEWLLDRRFPAVRRLTLLRALGRSGDDPEVSVLEAHLVEDPWVATLLAGEWRNGARDRVRVHPYKKWGGAYWRLVVLAELGVTVDTPGARPALDEAFEQVVGWLLGRPHLAAVRAIDGRFRRCASQEGNALWAACRIGLGTKAELDSLAASLIRWQWPDGGWNCDVRPQARHSSFHESWAPLRGLVAYRSLRERATKATAPGGTDIDHAIGAVAEFFLRHRVVESERTGEPAHSSLVLLRWPPYWHYGLLPGLRAVHEAGWLGDPRVGPALERLAALRRDDGTWWPHDRWWRPPGGRTGVEIVDWGAEGERRMLTLHALEVLAAAGRQERRRAG